MMLTAKVEDYRFLTEEMTFLSLFPPIPKDPTFVIYCSLEQFNCVHLFYSDTAAVSPFGKGV